MGLKIKWKIPNPKESAGFTLWRAHNVWQRDIKAVLKPYGLTHVQYVLLAGLLWMEQDSEPVTQNQLAAFVEADEMMTSTVVRKLVEDGLMVREVHLDDARARSLGLTGVGRERVLAASESVETFESNFFRVFGDSVGFFHEGMLALSEK
ncbi:MAG: MarR family winged helix-turn-helix transcriptional regulator [bacterium]|nr:MarR family winged helix-turn-helix transcriptional regulator [bacterium]